MSTSWDLRDVQAGLNVVITILASLSITLFTRVLWLGHTTTMRVNGWTPVSNLVVISSLGDIACTAHLLRSKLFSSKYWTLCLQCIVVLTLSLLTVFSGPLARYSTRQGTTVLQLPISGRLAEHYESTFGYLSQQTNNINRAYKSLAQADFPLNQLPDFFPNPGADWLYRPNEWSSTWAADCHDSPLTMIEAAEATGNYSGYTAADSPDIAIFIEMPAMKQAIPKDWKTDPRNSGCYWLQKYSDANLQDVFVGCFTTLWTNPTQRENFTLVESWSFSVAAIYIRGAPQPPSLEEKSANVVFGSGPVAGASYTSTTCNITRNGRSSLGGAIAYPILHYPSGIGFSLLEGLTALFDVFSIAVPGQLGISGKDLFRFFQSYWLAKNTFTDPVITTRLLSTRVPAVEISTIFLAVTSVVTFLLMVSGVMYVIIRWYYRGQIRSTPASKIDWVLQAIQESSVEIDEEKPSHSEKALSNFLASSFDTSSKAAEMQADVASLSPVSASTTPSEEERLSKTTSPGSSSWAQKRVQFETAVFYTTRISESQESGKIGQARYRPEPLLDPGRITNAIHATKEEMV